MKNSSNNLEGVTSLSDKLSSFAHEISEEHADELWKMNLSQEIESNVQLLEENSGLCFQNQKPTEEASYAKELTSELSVQNTKLKKELLAARRFVNQTINGINRKYSDNTRRWKKGKHFGHSHDFSGAACDDFELWNFDLDAIAC
ncbi:hypothetical protein GOBAR_AA40390 [Gossypium barbadense]|uniref:Uncharacterized protein n=1 Tax=Gossypium barbadense TaxID=3634 RepID=A0A2P5VNB6_GOSBA|nr:hypothetical protein GOBAR_AA40390 [Gossypium barbadense]